MRWIAETLQRHTLKALLPEFDAKEAEAILNFRYD